MPFAYLAEEWIEYETILSHENFEIVAPEIKELLTRLAVDMTYGAQDSERELEEDEIADTITFKGGSGLGFDGFNGQEFKISFLKGIPEKTDINLETGASLCREKNLIDQSNWWVAVKKDKMVDCYGSLMVGVEFAERKGMSYAGEEGEKMTLKRETLPKLLAKINGKEREAETATEETTPDIESKPSFFLKINQFSKTKDTKEIEGENFKIWEVGILNEQKGVIYNSEGEKQEAVKYLLLPENRNEELDYLLGRIVAGQWLVKITSDWDIREEDDKTYWKLAHDFILESATEALDFTEFEFTVAKEYEGNGRSFKLEIEPLRLAGLPSLITELNLMNKSLGRKEEKRTYQEQEWKVGDRGKVKGINWNPAVVESDLEGNYSALNLFGAVDSEDIEQRDGAVWETYFPAGFAFDKNETLAKWQLLSFTPFQAYKARKNGFRPWNFYWKNKDETLSIIGDGFYFSPVTRYTSWGDDEVKYNPLEEKWIDVMGYEKERLFPVRERNEMGSEKH